MFSSVLCKNTWLSPWVAWAQNNFWMVAGHDDQQKKFLLGQVLFSDQSKSWGKNELILMLSSISKCDCIFAKKQSLWFTGEDLAVCSRKTGQHDWRVEPLIWPVKTPFWLSIVCWTAGLALVAMNPLTFVIHLMQLKCYNNLTGKSSIYM